MTDDRTGGEPVLDPAPDDLDGHSIEELADYLDRGGEPSDPSIEASASCRHALAALARLRTVSDLLVQEDVARETPRDDEWVAGVLQAIALDAHAGADIPFAAGGSTVVTEGAIRGLIRAAGDDVPGFMVGRIRFHGDPTDRTRPFRIALDVSVLEGFAIPGAVASLRAAVGREVTRHTGIAPLVIDVDVRDLRPAAPGTMSPEVAAVDDTSVGGDR